MRKQRNTSPYSTPASFTLPFLYQKQVVFKGAYGGNKRDYRNEKVVHGNIRALSQKEINNFQQSSRTYVDYEIKILYTELPNLEGGDRFILLSEDANYEVFRVESYADENLRREYLNIKVSLNSFTNRGTSSGKKNGKVIYKGVSSLLATVIDGRIFQLTQLTRGSISDFLKFEWTMDIVSDISEASYVPYFSHFIRISKELIGISCSPAFIVYREDFPDLEAFTLRVMEGERIQEVEVVHYPTGVDDVVSIYHTPSLTFGRDSDVFIDVTSVRRG